MTSPDVVLRKLMIADMLLAMLDRDPDPRAPEVARILREQRAELAARLPDGREPMEKQDEAGERPPAQVVGLKTLSLDVKRL